MTAYFSGPRIAMGPAALEEAYRIGAARPAVIVDPTVARLGLDRRLLDELGRAGATTERIVLPEGEPTVAGAGRLADALRPTRPDQIVALGGGRTIDAAKAAWLLLARPDLPLEGRSPLDELRLRAVAGFVAVPTTCGSGADVSWSAVVRSADAAPIELASRELVPDWSLLDPTLLESLPVELVAATAAGLVAHALEATLSAWANPFSDALGRDALATAFRELPIAMKRAGGEEARSALQHAASLAGLAASNAQFGAAHALALALGPVDRCPYGRLVGTILPYVAEFNYPSARDRYQALAPILGPRASTDRSAVAERLRGLWNQARIPRTLAEAGVPEELRRERRAVTVARARSVASTMANPRVPTEEEYGRLLDAAFEGSAVTF